MALVNELVEVDDPVNAGSGGVAADYCFNESIFQIRTYKKGDNTRACGSKQNVQLSKKMAADLLEKLQTFIDQSK
ncbi:MAG: hypothetical protein D3923_19315 [Candidatus Electrothrix sp. AR3]|nr:hypothetical protein [Candidatus Electrothrix sp. AR3]